MRPAWLEHPLLNQPYSRPGSHGTAFTTIQSCFDTVGGAGSCQGQSQTHPTCLKCAHCSVDAGMHNGQGSNSISRAALASFNGVNSGT